MAETKLLEIKNLTVNYNTADGIVHAVDNLNLSIGHGETLGLVGETGAGKTTSVKAIMRILQAPPADVTNGEILFEGEDLLKKPAAAMREIRGAKISMVFQDPMTSLNPVKTVVDQIIEAIELHQKADKRELFDMACAMLEKVGIRSERARDFPHLFSGGMKQRVVIAMALACNPQLLIADEPTSALDVTIQAQVLELMKSLRTQYNTSVIMITHDLGIVAETCDHVAIMYAGSIVEYGTKEHLFINPQHPYTQGLFACIPDIFSEDNELKPIKGLMPDPSDLPTGCRFHPRCDKVFDRCSKEFPLAREIEPGHTVSCHLMDDLCGKR